ncbi:MAG: RdgB/HAM1 family non-canonical purine NTP pyrophosphatase [Armatimonadota bacterium]|nr:RdgB/HAM1 family non-canonical purine NTP pyrophosphatase [Armatimonadota bacterium]
MGTRSRPSRTRRRLSRTSSPASAAPAGGLLDVVLATRNPGKVREMLALLRDLPLRVYDLTAFPRVPDLPEEGQTYTENAISKALTVARLTGRVALADDSGIEIAGLGGGPGPHSRRFLGPQASDAARNARILKMLQNAPPEARRARYRAVVAVATPQGVVRTFEGVCEGEIAPAPRGSHGFGYDPIFLVPEFGKTMAQLPPAVKNRISHRARAIAAARPFLRMLATGRPTPSEP